MVSIITKDGIWSEAKDFTDALNKIEKNLIEFDHGDKIILVDFEIKQTVFLEISKVVKEY